MSRSREQRAMKRWLADAGALPVLWTVRCAAGHVRAEALISSMLLQGLHDGGADVRAPMGDECSACFLSEVRAELAAAGVLVLTVHESDVPRA